MRTEVDGDLSMFGSCFLKLILTVVFKNNIFGAYLFAFFTNYIFFLKKKKNKENIKTRLVPKSLFVFLCYLVF